jgi:hypothetical protein
MAADLPLCVDHFRYFAGAIRGKQHIWAWRVYGKY